MKACRKCRIEKPRDQFRSDPRYRDGIGSWCIQCHRERNSSWARENRERLTAKAAVWRDNNPDKARRVNLKFKAANKSRLAEQHSAWAKRNKDKRRVSWARHRAAKMRATPSWAAHDRIAAIYRAAVELQRQTGIRLHVDHIVPLQGKNVCGLHWEANLQIIPGELNEAKRNKWCEQAYAQPDMFVQPAPKPVQEAML